MRFLTSSLLLLAFASIALADIQDPPAKKYGVTRKFSRGIANIVYGINELPTTVIQVNDTEGNSTAITYGVISGLRRTLERFGMGVFEVATHPFPINHGSYRPYFKSPTRGNHGTYEEFPPEQGFDSKYDYVRPQSD